MGRRCARLEAATPLAAALLTFCAAISAADCELLPQQRSLGRLQLTSSSQRPPERAHARKAADAEDSAEEEQQPAARSDRGMEGAWRDVAAIKADWAASAEAAVSTDNVLLPSPRAPAKQRAGRSPRKQRRGAHQARLRQRALHESADRRPAWRRSAAHSHRPAAPSRRPAQPSPAQHSPATATAAQRAATRKAHALQRLRAQKNASPSRRNPSLSPGSKPAVSRRCVSGSLHRSCKQARGKLKQARRPSKPRRPAKPAVKAVISLDGAGGPASCDARTRTTTALLVQEQMPSDKVGSGHLHDE